MKLLLPYIVIAYILSVPGSCQSQQKSKEWPFQVSLRMATILIQGDTGTVVTETRINGERVPEINFSLEKYKLLPQEYVDTVMGGIVLFLNAFLWPENKPYPINKYALSLDSFSFQAKPFNVISRSPYLLVAAGTREERLRLLTACAAYDINGHALGEDSILFNFYMKKPFPNGMTDRFLNVLLFSTYKYVAHEKLQKFNINYFFEGTCKKLLVPVDSTFLGQYNRYISRLTTNLDKIHQLN